MGLTGTTSLLIAASAGAGLIAVLFAGARRIERFFGWVGDLRDQWFGTPAEPGIPARPGVMQRLSDQDAHLASQDKHLAEQDGQLDRIERQVNELREHLGRQ